MKKVFLAIACLFMLLLMHNHSNYEVVGEEGLYAFTKDTTEFDEFAEKDLGNHVVAYYGLGAANWPLKLGKGITIYGASIPGVLYPVWRNDKIIGVYYVNYYKEQYSGSYSDSNTKELNYAIGKTNPDHPLRILKTKNWYYYSIGHNVYNMNGNIGVKINDFKVKLTFFKAFLFAEGKSVNVNETLNYIPIELD